MRPFMDMLYSPHWILRKSRIGEPVRPALANATAAAELARLNGAADLMERGHCAMHAACTMPNWKGSGNSKQVRSARNPRSTSAVMLTLRAARLESMSGHAASFVDYGAEILKILCYE